MVGPPNLRVKMNNNQLLDDADGEGLTNQKPTQFQFQGLPSTDGYDALENQERAFRNYNISEDRLMVLADFANGK